MNLTEICDEVAGAFYQNHIGIGHALLLAGPTDMQTLGLTACLREAYAGGGDKPPRILLPVRALRFWIETNVPLLLKDAPFDKRNTELVPAAVSYVNRPKPTGHNNFRCGFHAERSEEGIWVVMCCVPFMNLSERWS